MKAQIILEDALGETSALEPSPDRTCGAAHMARDYEDEPFGEVFDQCFHEGHTRGAWEMGQHIERALGEVRQMSVAITEMLELLWQYESDLMHPPEGDSRDRRLARVRATIKKVEELS